MPFVRLLSVGWLLLPITLYRYCLSPLFGQNCRYVPSCSAYCAEALQKHGLFSGGWMGLKRLMRCHPWGGCGLDPVPDSEGKS